MPTSKRQKICLSTLNNTIMAVLGELSITIAGWGIEQPIKISLINVWTACSSGIKTEKVI